MAENIFNPGGVPVVVAAKVYKKDPAWVRAGLREGWLEIGMATMRGGRFNYYISPKKLYEETGYLWEGKDE